MRFFAKKEKKNPGKIWNGGADIFFSVAARNDSICGSFLEETSFFIKKRSFVTQND
jgi:hypothetical protein